jgi:hypothetical protein
MGSLTATAPERHGLSADASGRLERPEQRSDMESMEECIEADNGLMTSSKVTHEVPSSMNHGGPVTNYSFSRLTTVSRTYRP